MSKYSLEKGTDNDVGLKNIVLSVPLHDSSINSYGGFSPFFLPLSKVAAKEK
jgi:hypothetical protein